MTGPAPAEPTAAPTASRRTWLWPLLGAMLAQGSPLGLLALRIGAGQVPASRLGVLDSLSDDILTYAYLAFATGVVFAVAAHAAARAADRLEALATTDPLTGVTTRRATLARLDQELSRAARSGAPLALMIVDVDHLKRTNDAWGHGNGDEHLRVVGRVLMDGCRATDLVGRLGGDEFCVVLPETTGLQAMTLATRVRRSLDDHRLPTGRVTVSIGIADLDRAPSPRVQALYDAADRALYLAKERGRDRAVLAEIG